MNVFAALVRAFLLFASYLAKEANTKADDQNKGISGNSSECSILEVSEKSVNVSWCELEFQNATRFMVEMIPSPSRSDCETKSVNTTDCRTAIDGLCAAASYNVTVKSTDNIENDSYTCTVSTNPGIPDAPWNLIAEVLSSSQVNLSWTKPNVTNGPINGYYVFWEGSEDYNDTRILGDIQTYHVPGLKPYTNYTFYVSAFNIHNDTDLPGENATQSETTFAEVPGAPWNLIAEVLSSSQVNLSWAKPNVTNGPIDGYYVFWEGSEKYNDTRIWGDNQTYHVLGLKPYTNYTFYVSAFNIHNASDLPGENATQRETTFVAAPDAPLNFKVVVLSSSQVSLSWDKPNVTNGPIDGYYVFWEGSENYYDKNISENILTHHVKDLKPYTSYTFSVSAFNIHNATELPGENATQKETTFVAAPSPPRNFKTTATTNTTISLEWEEPDELNGPLDGYEITFVSEYPEDNKTKANSADLRHEEINLKPWTNYNVSVQAYNFDSKDPTTKLFSHEVKIHAKTQAGTPCPPRNFKTTITTNSTISLEWEEPTEQNGPLDGYEITFISEYPEDNKTKTNTTKLTHGKNNLKPWTNYNISVQAYNFDSKDPNIKLFSREVVIYTKTQTGTPCPPRNVKTTSTTNTTISLEWEEPVELNGPLDGYEITFISEYPEDNQTKANSTNLRYEESNLKPWTNYNVSVQAYNFDSKDPTMKLFSQEVMIHAKTQEGRPPIPDRDWEDLKNISQFLLKEEIVTTDKTQDFLFLNSLFSEKNGKIEHYVALVSGKLQMDLEAKQGSATFNKANFPLWNETDTTAMYRASPDYWNPLLESYFYSYNENPLPCRSTEIGDLFICTLGMQEDCEPGETFCNRPLEPDTEYLLKIRAYTKSGWSETKAMKFRTEVKKKPNHLLDDSSGSAGTVWGIIIPLFLLFVIGGVAVYKFKDRIFKKQAAQKRDENGNGDIRNGDIVLKVMNTRIKISDFTTRIAELHANSQLLFSQEYEELKKRSSVFPKEAATLPENIKKNRFVNILPFDQTRVKLNVDEELGYKEYINANYIQTPGSKQVYIATQGPLPETVSDFWRMIWENKVTTIVMLTQCVERGKVKCDKYWPDQGQPSIHGQIQVVSKSETFFSGNIIRMFSVQLGEEKRKVTQLDFTKWPDFNVPENPDQLINFVVAVRDHMPSLNPRPILAHCSAGVGRTGTYIAVDLIKERIQSGEESVDIFNTVLDLRKCRQNMVQTEDQYIFIYDCVKEIIDKELSRKSKMETDGEEIYSNLQEIA